MFSEPSKALIERGVEAAESANVFFAAAAEPVDDHRIHVDPLRDSPVVTPWELEDFQFFFVDQIPHLPRKDGLSVQMSWPIQK